MYKKITTIEETYGTVPVTASKDNEEDIIKVDVPLMIRLLEYAREDSKNDLDLHFMTKHMIELSEKGEELTMNDYEKIIAKEKK